MYERFYQLRERPFALSPDPEYLYPSRVHREALDYLRYGLESHAGFVVITGEIGSGKTTLLQTLMRGLDSQTTVGRIVNTLLEPRELIETIMIDFGLEGSGRSKPQMLRDLAQYLVDQRLAGRLVLLIIDEAQNLSLGALEELRMLSNLETEKSKLLQIVLVGQPNLRDKLAAPELEQLRQRITVSYHLQPLDATEAANYINHRLRRAAIGAPLEFPRDATNVIHSRSRGVPRLMNVICDAALVFGYAEERRQIDLPVVREVLAELETTGVLPSDGSPATLAAPGTHTTYEEELRQAEAVSREAMDMAARRVAEIDQREAAVRARERELAEQRRILAEEYRLLRMQRSAPVSAAAARRPHVATESRPERFTASARPGLWAWVKRVATGGSDRPMETH
jgi:general secretion pathway protein A